MAIDPNQKLTAKANRLSKERSDVDAQIKELEERKRKLGNELIETLTLLGTNRVRPTKGGPGYVLQRPTKTVWNEEALLERLKTLAPKVAKSVFKTERVVKFDEKALGIAIDKGDVPGADEILNDDNLVSIVEMSPRLMPLKVDSADA